MYRPHPRILKLKELNPIAFPKFSAQLKSLAVNHFKLNQDTILPSRAVCSDESEAQVIYSLAACFGNNPFNFGRVGGVIATDRTPAAAHHGQDIVLVAATHVGYDPSQENINARFGRMYRPRMGLEKNNMHAYSTCCGKLTGVIGPFLKLYKLASGRKISLFKKEFNNKERYCISINDHLLSQKGEAFVLNLNMSIMVKHKNNMPVVLEGRANSTVFEASDELSNSLKSKGFVFSAEPRPIGNYLSAKYFSFEQSNIPMKEDGSHLLLKNLLPYMNLIVSHPIPELAAANIAIAHEFTKTVTIFRRKQKELDIENKSILLIAGIDLNVFDHELAKENPLLGYQVYFCPFAAYFKSREDSYGKVFEKEEILKLLNSQPIEAEISSITEAAEKIPKEIIF